MDYNFQFIFCCDICVVNLDGYILSFNKSIKYAIMCNVFCSQFKGWCKSFTKLEIYLCLAQAVLLAGFIAFLTFLILHFIACRHHDIITISNETSIHETHTENSHRRPTTLKTLTLEDNGQCTWEPSRKTVADTHYYYEDHHISTEKVKLSFNTTQHGSEYRDELDIFSLESDGVLERERKSFVLALVKLKPPQDVVFGCILTVVNHFWTITAASCIESIEEVDSLDSFVMMERFGEKHEHMHAVSDVMIHPLYRGTNKSYDLAVMKSEDKLNIAAVAKLPNVLDYLLITLGENLDILGFGRFRSIDKNPLSRRVRAVTVNVVPLQQCEADDESWALRHLVDGGEVSREAGGGGAVCAGPVGGRANPCNYCAGTPLLRSGVVLGIMSSNRHCGLACEPNLYVNLVDVRNWLDSVVRVTR